MPYIRETTIFQVTTAPTDLSRAIPHTGGWSENVWYFSPPGRDSELALMRQKRAVLLPKQAKIIGYRRAQFSITNGQLVPLGAASGSLNIPGNNLYNTDLPQVSLQIDFSAIGPVNVSHQMIRCIPDQFMAFGEYQPNGAFAGAVTQYINSLITNAAFSFIGRDLTQPLQRVQAIANGATALLSDISVDAVPPGLAVDEMVRLIRVRDDDGNPLVGRFRVTAITGKVVTVTPRIPGILTSPSGFIRRDVLTSFAMQNAEVKRARVKKIGRPSEGYRGRRSKQRA